MDSIFAAWRHRKEDIKMKDPKNNKSKINKSELTLELYTKLLNDQVINLHKFCFVPRLNIMEFLIRNKFFHKFAVFPRRAAGNQVSDHTLKMRRLKPLAIMFSEFYFYLTAFIDDEKVRERFASTIYVPFSSPIIRAVGSRSRMASISCPIYLKRTFRSFPPYIN